MKTIPHECQMSFLVMTWRVWRRYSYIIITQWLNDLLSQFPLLERSSIDRYYLLKSNHTCIHSHTLKSLLFSPSLTSSINLVDFHFTGYVNSIKWIDAPFYDNLDFKLHNEWEAQHDYNDILYFVLIHSFKQ